MNNCSYCNDEMKTIDGFKTDLFKGVEAEFGVWINTGHLCLTLDSINGYTLDDDTEELISRKIKYCPICGRKFEVDNE